MSWNLQQPITSELAANKANKDGTDFTNPATWRSGLDVVSTNETRRQGTIDYAAVTFDGATTSTRITSTLTGQNIGTGDFSLWSRFRVPALAAFASNPGVISLGQSASDGTGNNSFRIILLSGGSLSIRSNDGSGVSTNSDVSGFSAAYSGQVVDIVVTRTGSTVKLYINGTDTAITGTLNGSNSITSTYCHVGIGAAGSAVFSGRIYRSVVFNRALSASDVTELITTGVNPADQWGTQTQIVNTTTLNGGFETAGAGGVDVFANWQEYTAGTATLTRDTTDYSPDLGSTASAKATGTDGTAVWSLYNSTVGSLVANKRYRLSAAHKRSSSASVGWKTSSTNITIVTFSITTSWANYSAEFVMPSNETIKVDGGGSVTLWTDNVIYERIGAIVDLDFTVGTGYQAYDRTSNAFHGTLFGGVEWMMPRRMATLYATTSTSGNQQMLGSLAIPTNAIIEDIIVNSTGSATVSVGNASAGTQIVNGASVVAGRQKLTLATPFSTTGNLWVNSNSTATLQFTILYTIAQ